MDDLVNSLFGVNFEMWNQERTFLLPKKRKKTLCKLKNHLVSSLTISLTVVYLVWISKCETKKEHFRCIFLSQKGKERNAVQAHKKLSASVRKCTISLTVVCLVSISKWETKKERFVVSWRNHLRKKGKEKRLCMKNCLTCMTKKLSNYGRVRIYSNFITNENILELFSPFCRER